MHPEFDRIMKAHRFEVALRSLAEPPSRDELLWQGGAKLLSKEIAELRQHIEGLASVVERAQAWANSMRGLIARRMADQQGVIGPRSPLSEAYFWYAVDLIGGAAGGLKMPRPRYGFDSWAARMTDPHWWARKLAKLEKRRAEHERIAAGEVSRRRDVYCSDECVKEWREGRAANLEFAQQCVVFNDDADVAFLAEVAKRSISNPEIRRKEMFTRLRGMEEYAKAQGHSALFVTWTCPSRMHATSGKYDGTSPAEAQSYLVGQLAKCRAAWGRETKKRPRMEPYGMRIAEPHHDGCPHWHFLLFMPAEHIPHVKALMNRYALQVDGTEQGASKYRITFEDIDPERGSAVGYVSKYISKNIDGKGNDGESIGVATDLDGVPVGDAIEVAERVLAWASRWGIRQFQQIGGECIGPWRELRRLDAKVESCAILEAARQAADDGDYCRYIEVARQAHIVTEKNREYCNRYGEPAPVVVGVACGSAAVVTRRDDWRLMRLADVYDAYESADTEKWSDLLGQVVHNISQGGFYSGGANAPPLDLCQ